MATKNALPFIAQMTIKQLPAAAAADDDDDEDDSLSVAYSQNIKRQSNDDKLVECSHVENFDNDFSHSAFQLSNASIAVSADSHASKCFFLSSSFGIFPAATHMLTF